MTMSRRQILGAGLALFPAALAVPGTRRAGAQDAIDHASPPAPLAFDIEVWDQRFGEHVVQFSRSGDLFTVATRIDCTVRLLDVTLYSFQHESEETYREERLIRFSSKTIDGDFETKVEGKAEDDGFVLTGRRGTVVAPADIRAATFWTPVIMTRDRLIDPKRGDVKAQTVHGQDRTVVRIGGEDRLATRYRVSGIVDGSATYDDDGRWVAATVRKRGVDVLYRPRF
jgi:hypothetical protein